MIILETERLILREFELEDAAFILELLNTPSWLKYIGDRSVYSLEDARAYLENRLMKSYKEYGFGFYLIKRKSDSVSIGIGGLVKRDSLENVDIGYALLPDYEGKGYAYEASLAVLNFAKNQLQLPVIVAITIAENHASIRLLEKLGLTFTKTVQMSKEEMPLSLYRIAFDL